MFGNNSYGASRSYPMLNPPAFINPYPAAAPLGMGTGGFLPQQISPVQQQQPQAPAGGQTLGMAMGGYLPQQAPPAQQPQQPQQTPGADILSMLQSYMAQRPQQSPPARPALPSRAAPYQMGLGSLPVGSNMPPQMPNMFGFSRPGI